MAHRARKRFGQNFLEDPAVIHQLIECIHPQANDELIEIGPGQGALTRALLPKVKSITGIELDRDLIPILKKQCANMGSLTILQHDALLFDYSSLVPADQKMRLVGNLPYNISTPLLFHLIKYLGRIKNMHFMLQEEVVQRLAAQATDSAYGQLSVLIQYHCKVEHLLSVDPSAFSPQPKVNSAFVRLTPHTVKPHIAKNDEHFQYLVKKSFTHPRKTLRNNLKALFSTEQMEQLPIDLQRRPQELSLANYVALSNHCGNMSPLNGVSDYESDEPSPNKKSR